MGCAFSETVAPLPDESQVNRTHFTTSRMVGKGGFGEVRLATKLTGADEGTTYAMKIYTKRGLLQHSSGVKEVIWELSMLATLDTPWLCNARYAFQDEAHCYLVMDLALGGDLRYHLQQEIRFTEERSRIYLAQIYLAFEYLHSRKVLHRDIKPANVVLDADGFVKVTDMGISAHLNSNNVCTKASGTPSFMAPELYTASLEHSFASDWWSYGITAHHLITGRPPFTRNAFKTEKRIVVEAGELEKDAPSYPTPTLYFKEGTVLSRRSSCMLHVPTTDGDSETGGVGGEGGPVVDDAAARKEKQHRQKRSVQVSPECALFVDQLLHKNPANRLGAKSSQEVKNHPFFAGFDWEALKARTLPVPFVPDTTKDNFCNDDDVMAEIFGVDNGDELFVVPEKQRHKFKDYHFNTALLPDQDLDGLAFFKDKLKLKFPSMKLDSARRFSTLISSRGSNNGSQRRSGRKTTGHLDAVGEQGEGGGGGGLIKTVSRRFSSLISSGSSSRSTKESPNNKSGGLNATPTAAAAAVTLGQVEEEGGLESSSTRENGSKTGGAGGGARSGDNEENDEKVGSSKAAAGELEEGGGLQAADSSGGGQGGEEDTRGPTLVQQL